MLEVTIQVPEPMAAELSAARDRLPEVLAYGLGHLPTVPNEIYQYVLEFLISQPSPEAVWEFGPMPEMQERVSHLLEKNRADTLTANEAKELDEYARINHLITMIKARALPFLTPEN